jgi:hypothetical protein
MQNLLYAARPGPLDVSIELRQMATSMPIVIENEKGMPSK